MVKPKSPIARRGVLLGTVPFFGSEKGDCPLRRSRVARRGVLLLLILGILAMFGVVAIALVVIARQAKNTAEINSRIDVQASRPRDDLNQAAMQVFRGSNNPDSVLRPHSLLEDIYGNKWYRGQITAAAPPAPVAPYEFPVGTVTDGQLIELSYTLFGTGGAGTVEDAQQRVGCVVTFVGGPSAGVSTRIVGVNPANGNPQLLAGPIRLLGLDGSPGVDGVDDDGVNGTDDVGEIGWTEDIDGDGHLDVNEPDDNPANGILDPAEDFDGDGHRDVDEDANGNGNLDESDDGLHWGNTFLVNGVPFSGTGFGYNTSPTDPDVLLDRLVGGYPDALQPNVGNASAQANEDYDAPDYQNMLLAMAIPPIDTDGDGIPDTLPQVPVPSLHRPALINYWQNTAPRPSDSSYILRPTKPSFISNNPMDYVNGPWDVDNDGDGITDSIWVDLGMPGRTTPDGRRYKPLFAILCVDLDGRLNLNAHGSSVESIADYYFDVDSSPLHYAGGGTSQPLARGQGTGTAEINLAPLLDHDRGATPDNTDLARYRRILRGGSGIDGRYGEVLTTAASRRAGRSLAPLAYNDPLSANQHFRFFWDSANPLNPLSAAAYNYFDSTAASPSILSAFGSPFDLSGSFALALDVRGQPIYRVYDFDGDTSNSSGDWQAPAVNDPYELDLSRHAARSINNNAPVDNAFSAGELERLLRPYDVDATTLPQRLAALHPSGETTSLLLPHSEDLNGNGTLDAGEDLDADGNIDNLPGRRYEVTTESWDLPSPSVAMTPALRDALEPDDATPPADGAQARHISELFLAAGIAVDELDDLLPRELLAGLRMDLNRPFGNGRDDNANFVVDDPGEAATETLPLLNAASAEIANIDFDANNDGVTDAADRFARQVYARHLYVLLMTLVRHDTDANGTEEFAEVWYPPGLAPPPADLAEAQTARARALAQWAVNVVDYRDRDSIMTWFEYDLEPFTNNDANPGTWDVDGVVGPGSTDDGLAHRGLVWGCERPELLITEAVALHDRRTEDTSDEPTGTKTDDATDPDTNFDQAYRPQGSLFIELFNPWTDDEPSPGEFYYDHAGSAWSDGVVLNQVSPSGSDPVWRLVIVKDDPTTPAVDETELDPDDPDTADRPTIDRSVYFVDPSALPAAATAADGQAYYRTGALSAIPRNGYAVIGPAETAGTDPLVTFVAFENGQTLGDITTTRHITLDSSVVTSAAPYVVVHNDGGQPASANVDAPVVVPVTQPQRLSISEPATVPAYTAPGGTYNPATGKYDITFDDPLDLQDQATEWATYLSKSETFPSYARIHLQRLANPLEPWALETAADPNPYRTVDSMTVDLTCFNGVTNDINQHTTPDGDEHNNNDGTDTMFHTLERGVAEEPDNNLWRQEVPRTGVTNDTTALTAVHYFGRTLQHSLGYLNLPFGAPRDNTDGYRGASSETPVFPWLNWANRPFVGQMELLQVPTRRSSGLLAVDPNPVTDHPELPGFDVSTGADPYTDPAGPFPHLLNFFHQDTASTPPSGHFYRLLEFVHVPSPFVGTEIQGHPVVFEGIVGGSHSFHPPFHGLSRYREPGRINLNTIFSPDVWTGLMNYFPGSNLAYFEHEFIVSRRGYGLAQTGTNDPAAEMLYIHPTDPPMPTYFANPFRPFAGRELVPIAALGTGIGEPVNATLLRPSPSTLTRPLFAYENPTDEFVNTNRNPQFRYQAMQKLGNLVTTRSNVYAVWITVGYFAVDNNGNPGAEMGSDLGDVDRHRAFYIFDRSIPVGFQRGQDLNVEQAILVKRFIE